jgi:hypothetical protein
MVKLAKKIPLTPREFAFAEALLTGMNQSDALRHAYPELVKKWKVQSIHCEASRMAKNPKIVGYIQEQLANRQRRRIVKEEDLLSRIEKRATLADCVRSDRVEWGTRLQAIKVDNEMTGDSAIRVEQEVTLAVILRNLEAGSAVPTEEEKAMLATPVQALPVALAPENHSNGHSRHVPGPFEADFAEIEGNIAPQPSNDAEHAKNGHIRRSYEE